MISCQGTTQARKSNTHVFDIGPKHEHTHARGANEHSPLFAPSPLVPQPDGLVRIISAVVRDHASLVTHSNQNLVGTTVIEPSQR